MKPILWITDSWHTLDHPKETTLRLMEESLIQKTPTYWCDHTDIFLSNDAVCIFAKKVLKILKSRLKDDFTFSQPKKLDPHFFSAIHYRPDPPIDHRYLYPLLLLNQAQMKNPRIKIINSPQAIFSGCEKFDFLLPKNLTPKTLVSSQKQLLVNFGRTLKKTVLKTLYFAQSKNVELLLWDTEDNLKKSETILEEFTKNFTVPVLLQEFLSEIKEGEKRFWFAKYKMIAAVLKHPLNNDFKVLIDQGSVVEPYLLTKNDKKTIHEITKYLKMRKFTLAAVDLIGSKITDINFTSPGLIVQMEEILKENLSKKILRELSK